jgi:hypothetical protein
VLSTASIWPGGCRGETRVADHRLPFEFFIRGSDPARIAFSIGRLSIYACSGKGNCVSRGGLGAGKAVVIRPSTVRPIRGGASLREGWTEAGDAGLC